MCLDVGQVMKKQLSALICLVSILVPHLAAGTLIFSSGIASGGGAPQLVAFSIYLPGAPANNFTAEIGFKFVCTANRTITQLGRWKIAGNSQVHTNTIRDSGGALLGSVAVDMSTATAGQFNFATLGSPIAVTAGNTYYVMTTEINGGDQWYNDNVGQTGSVSTDFTAMESSFTSGYYDGSLHAVNASSIYGPTNFKFTNP